MAILTQPEALDRLESIVRRVTKKEHKITETTHLIEDDILDSLDFMNYVFDVQEEFSLDISDEDLEQQRLGSIGNMTRYLIANHPQSDNT